MRRRLGLIPLTLLAVLFVAWIFRWDYTGQSDGGIYYQDRWLGQTWVKDHSEPAQPDHPVIAAEVIDQATQTAIDADPSLSAEFQALQQEIVQQTAIRNANEPYAQEYTKILSDQSNNNALRLLTGEMTTEEISIPEEILQGDKLYEQSSYQLLTLTQQKEDLWQSARSTAKQSIYDNTANQRQLAANIVAALGMINLIWLVYGLCFYRPQTDSVAKGPLEAGTRDDEIKY